VLARAAHTERCAPLKPNHWQTIYILVDRWEEPSETVPATTDIRQGCRRVGGPLTFAAKSTRTDAKKRPYRQASKHHFRLSVKKHTYPPVPLLPRTAPDSIGGIMRGGCATTITTKGVRAGWLTLPQTLSFATPQKGASGFPPYEPYPTPAICFEVGEPGVQGRLRWHPPTSHLLLVHQIIGASSPSVATTTTIR
jgi:hypothetical protein